MLARDALKIFYLNDQLRAPLHAPHEHPAHLGPALGQRAEAPDHLVVQAVDEFGVQMDSVVLARRLPNIVAGRGRGRRIGRRWIHSALRASLHLSLRHAPRLIILRDSPARLHAPPPAVASSRYVSAARR